MTIKELYEWAKRNGIENYMIAIRSTIGIPPDVRRLKTKDIKV